MKLFTTVIFFGIYVGSLCSCQKSTQATAPNKETTKLSITKKEFIARFGDPQHVFVDGSRIQLTYEGLKPEHLSATSRLIGFIYIFENDYLVDIRGMYSSKTRVVPHDRGELKELQLSSGKMWMLDFTQDKVQKEIQLFELLQEIKFDPVGLTFSMEDKYNVLSLVTAVITVYANSDDQVKGVILLSCDLMTALANNYMLIKMEVIKLRDRGKKKMEISELRRLLNNL
jgi:uncharacterized protein (UPF0262 family)